MGRDLRDVVCSSADLSRQQTRGWCALMADWLAATLVVASGVRSLKDIIEQVWRPAITGKQILVGTQDLLDEPNPNDPIQTEGYHMFIQALAGVDAAISTQCTTNDRDEYRRRIRQQAKQYPPEI